MLGGGSGKDKVEWSGESEIRKLDFLTVGKACELHSNVLQCLSTVGRNPGSGENG